MAAEALAGEMEERASQMHIPEFVWSVAPSLASAAAPAANTFLAEPIQRHHPPSVFPWVKISMAWVDIKRSYLKNFDWSRRWGCVAACSWSTNNLEFFAAPTSIGARTQGQIGSPSSLMRFPGN